MQPDDTVWKSDALAERYLEGVRGAIPLAAEQIRVLLHLVREATPDPEHILDLGCGDGVLGRALLAQFPSAHCVFLDFSDYMLGEARAKLGNQARAHTFLREDYGDPDWAACLEKRRFDLVVSGFSIHHQPDARKQAIYGEIFDCLKPGGLFLNLEHVASASTWGTLLFDAFFVDALYQYHTETGGKQSREEVAETYYSRPDKSANILAPVEEQCRWLREIGFKDVDCFFKVFELALFGGRRGSEL